MPLTNSNSSRLRNISNSESKIGNALSYFIDMVLYAVLGVALLAIAIMLVTKGRTLNIRAPRYVTIVLEATIGAVIVALSFFGYLWLRYPGQLVVLGFTLGFAPGFVYTFHHLGARLNVFNVLYVLLYFLFYFLCAAFGVAVLIAGIYIAKMARFLLVRVMGYTAIVLGLVIAGFVIRSWWWWLHYSYHD